MESLGPHFLVNRFSLDTLHCVLCVKTFCKLMMSAEVYH